MTQKSRTLVSTVSPASPVTEPMRPGDLSLPLAEWPVSKGWEMVGVPQPAATFLEREAEVQPGTIQRQADTGRNIGKSSGAPRLEHGRFVARGQKKKPAAANRAG